MCDQYMKEKSFSVLCIISVLNVGFISEGVIRLERIKRIYTVCHSNRHWMKILAFFLISASLVLRLVIITA